MRSKALLELIGNIDTLERRVWGKESPAARTLGLDRIQDALTAAGRAYWEALAIEGGSANVRLDMSDAIRQFLDSSVGNAAGAGLLSIRDTALVQFTEDMFRNVESASDLDPAAYGAVQYLQLGMARTLILDPHALERRDHPMRLFCEFLISFLKGYDARSGDRAYALLGRVEGVVKRVVESALPAEEAYEAARAELIGLVDAYERDSLLFARNLIAKEKGEASRCDARSVVNRAILEAVAGRRLPRVLLQFLQQVWSKYLYITYLRRGMDSKEWRAGIDDIGILARSLDIRDSNELFRFYGSHLSRTLARIRAGAGTIYGDEAISERFFQAIDCIHMETMEGRMADAQDLVAVSADGLHGQPDSPALSAPRQLMVESLRVDSWYHRIDKGLALRCRLIERNRKYRYCLFTNLSGIKVAKQEYLQTALAVESGMLRPVDTTPVLDKAMAYAGTRLAEHIERLESQALVAERLRSEAKERRRQEEIAQQLRQLQQERLREQARLLEERRRRSQERARLEAEAREHEARQAREQALQQVLKDVERMQSGGSVELIDANQGKATCKLGLKLKSSGKMIFVDRLGRKMCELLPGELAQRIIDGSAGIVDYGVAFDDTLQSLIMERSEKIHVDEP